MINNFLLFLLRVAVHIAEPKSAVVARLSSQHRLDGGRAVLQEVDARNECIVGIQTEALVADISPRVVVEYLQNLCRVAAKPRLSL